MKDNNKKWLYSFEHESTINGNKVKKQFSILKPNRKLKEEGDIFYSAEVSRFAKAGVLPRAAWGTILSNSGGSISDAEREEYGKLLIEFRDKSFDIQKLLTKGLGSLSKEEKESFDKITIEIEDIKDSIQSFEADQINIFENTAEYKARNRTILWWSLFLAYNKNEDGTYSEIVPGDTFAEKLQKYDDLEESEENQYTLEVMSKMVYFVTLWFMGRASKTEDFELYAKDAFKSFNNTEEKDTSPETGNKTSEPLVANDKTKTSQDDDSDEGFLPEKIG